MRPVLEHNTSLTVTFGLALTQIIDVVRMFLLKVFKFSELPWQLYIPGILYLGFGGWLSHCHFRKWATFRLVTPERCQWDHVINQLFEEGLLRLKTFETFDQSDGMGQTIGYWCLDLKRLVPQVTKKWVLGLVILNIFDHSDGHWPTHPPTQYT